MAPLLDDPPLLDNPKVAARLRRDLWLSRGNSTAYDVTAGLARFLHTKDGQKPKSCEMAPVLEDRP